MNHTELILALYDNQMIKFGEFTLKSGKDSYIYADIRTAISYPYIYKAICDLLYIKTFALDYQFICGVPYSALTFASGIAYAHNLPMLLRRKEAKDYGTKKILEGIYQPNQKVLVIEDVITSGSSVLETTGVLEDHGLVITDICVLIERNQGGKRLLEDMGYRVHSIVDLKSIIDILHDNGRISSVDKANALKSIKI